MLCLFFFKQKTAYEMRISDWSSDVCSSDLLDIGRRDRVATGGECVLGIVQHPDVTAGLVDRVARRLLVGDQSVDRVDERRDRTVAAALERAQLAVDVDVDVELVPLAGSRGGVHGVELQRRRSAEHTSELQSLMRISYAVFCLQNKKKKN